MNLFVNVATAAQLCGGCALEFEVLDTLGAADDPAGVGVFAEVLSVGDLGYLASSEVLGGVVIVYDSAGNYQRELTREGDGPGELRAAPTFALGAGGGILMREPGSARLHLFSGDLSFKKTFRLPGVTGVWSIQPDPVTGGWLVTCRGDDFLEKKVLLLDHEGNVLRTLSADESSDSRGLPNVIRGPDGTIWSTSLFGLVEVFDEDLGILGSLQLELPGLEGWELPRDGQRGWPAQVNDIRPAPDGAGVWIFAIAPERSLDELGVDELRRGLMEQTLTPEQAADAFVYWVSLTPDGLELLGTDRFDTLVRPLGHGDLAYDIIETPDGNRRIRVGRLRFSRGEAWNACKPLARRDIMDWTGPAAGVFSASTGGITTR